MLEKFALGRWLTRTTRMWFVKNDFLHTQEVQGKEGAVMRLYDLFAPLYDLTFPRLEIYQATADHLVSTFVRPGDRVLDLGTGTGFLSLRIGPRARHVVAADLHHGMLLKAGKNARKESLAQTVSLCRANATEVPLASSRFDVVVSAYMEVYLTLDEKRAMLREIHRVLLDCGAVVFMTGPGEIATRYLKKDDWTRLLSEAGFTRISFTELYDVYRLVSARKPAQAGVANGGAR